MIQLGKISWNLFVGEGASTLWSGVIFVAGLVVSYFLGLFLVPIWWQIMIQNQRNIQRCKVFLFIFPHIWYMMYGILGVYDVYVYVIWNIWYILFFPPSLSEMWRTVWTPCGYVTKPSPRGEGVGGACSRRKPKERGPGGAVQNCVTFGWVLLKGPTVWPTKDSTTNRNELAIWFSCDDWRNLVEIYGWWGNYILLSLLSISCKSRQKPEALKKLHPWLRRIWWPPCSWLVSMKVGLSFGGFGVEPASGIGPGQREVASKYFLSQARKSF